MKRICWKKSKYGKVKGSLLHHGHGRNDRVIYHHSRGHRLSKRFKMLSLLVLTLVYDLLYEVIW